MVQFQGKGRLNGQNQRRKIFSTKGAYNYWSGIALAVPKRTKLLLLLSLLCCYHIRQKEWRHNTSNLYLKKNISEWCHLFTTYTTKIIKNCCTFIQIRNFSISEIIHFTCFDTLQIIHFACNRGFFPSI